jgi:hypothetical protein
MVNSFWNAKALAEFDSKPEKESESNIDNKPDKTVDPPGGQEYQKKKINLGLNYTINLVLPKTDDPAIYDAIFKSLRDNLLND